MVRIEKVSAYTGTCGRDNPMLIQNEEEQQYPHITHTSQIGLLDDPEGIPSDLSFVHELTSFEQRL